MHIFTPFYPGTLTVWMLLLTGFLITGYALAIYLAQVKSNGDVMSTWLVAVLLCYYMIYLLLKLNVLATNFSYLAYYTWYLFAVKHDIWSAVNRDFVSHMVL
jgi:hypothetical protein